MHDDLDFRRARAAKERGEPLGAGRAVPAHFGHVVIEHADRVLRDPDELVERGDLRAHRIQRLLAWLRRRRTLRRRCGGSHRGTNRTTGRRPPTWTSRSPHPATRARWRAVAAAT